VTESVNLAKDIRLQWVGEKYFFKKIERLVYKGDGSIIASSILNWNDCVINR